MSARFFGDTVYFYDKQRLCSVYCRLIDCFTAPGCMKSVQVWLLNWSATFCLPGLSDSNAQ